MLATAMPASEADRVWFADQVERFLPDLFGTALRLVRNRPDAEDLVADAVSKAWLALASLQDRESLRGWLFRILTNAFLSSRRAISARGAHVPLDDTADEPEFSLFERLHQPFLLWSTNPEQTFLAKLLREDLERAIDGLADPFRMVVVMVDVQGWSYQDAAQALGVPLGTVRSRLARGRSALQRALWEHARDVGLIPSSRPREEA
jgi:RNA polymerase sigma-70 factor (ECF subfamily)